jgi:hypothetical protein
MVLVGNFVKDFFELTAELPEKGEMSSSGGRNVAGQA